MRKLFLGSAALFIFSLSVIIFQISCSKDAEAYNDDNNNDGDGKTVLYKKTTSCGIDELWLMNSNAGNRRKVNIVLPSTDQFITHGRITDNGNKIVLITAKLNETDNYRIFYKCNLDGSGLNQLFDGSQFEDYQLQDVY
jgi:hypothetical protein